MNQELLDYIKSAIESGISEDEIRSLLVEQGGWEEADLDKGFELVKNPNEQNRIAVEEPSKYVPSLLANKIPEPKAPIQHGIFNFLTITLVALFVVGSASIFILSNTQESLEPIVVIDSDISFDEQKKTKDDIKKESRVTFIVEDSEFVEDIDDEKILRETGSDVPNEDDASEAEVEQSIPIPIAGAATEQSSGVEIGNVSEVEDKQVAQTPPANVIVEDKQVAQTPPANVITGVSNIIPGNEAERRDRRRIFILNAIAVQFELKLLETGSYPIIDLVKLHETEKSTRSKLFFDSTKPFSAYSTPFYTSYSPVIRHEFFTDVWNSEYPATMYSDGNSYTLLGDMETSMYCKNQEACKFLINSPVEFKSQMPTDRSDCSWVIAGQDILPGQLSVDVEAGLTWSEIEDIVWGLGFEISPFSSNRVYANYLDGSFTRLTVDVPIEDTFEAYDLFKVADGVESVATDSYAYSQGEIGFIESCAGEVQVQITQ